MQGFLNQKKQAESECSIYSGNRKGSHVEAVGTYVFVLDLGRTFYVPSFSRNLISALRLVLHGFSFNFIGTSLRMLKDIVIVGDGILDEGLFRLYLNLSIYYSLTTMHDNVGIKRSVINEIFHIVVQEIGSYLH